MKVRPVETDFQGFRSVPAIVEARLHRGSRPFYERRFGAATPVQWPERWNMEGERWRGGIGKMEHEHHRFTGEQSLLDHRRKGYTSPKSVGKHTLKKGSKHNKYHCSGEAGSSSSSRRKWFFKKRRHGE